MLYHPSSGRFRDIVKNMACHTACVSAVELFVTCSYKYEKFAWIKK